MGNCNITPHVLDSHGEAVDNDTAANIIEERISRNRCVPIRDGTNYDQLRADYGIITSETTCGGLPSCRDHSGNLRDDVSCEFDPRDVENRHTLEFSSLSNTFQSCRGVRVFPLRADLFIGAHKNPEDMPQAFRYGDSICQQYLGSEWHISREFARRDGRMGYPSGPLFRQAYTGSGIECGLIGGSIYCERIHYKAPDLPCCLREWPGGVWGQNRESTTEYPPPDGKDNCFLVHPITGHVDMNRTCAPETASRDTPRCAKAIGEYCAGHIDLNGNPTHFYDLDISWLDERWIRTDTPFATGGKSICESQMDRYLSLPGGPGTANAISMMSELIRKMKLSRRGINDASDATSTTSARIWGIIYNYCNQYPGLCDQALFDYCEQYNYQDLINDVPLTRLCGCFMPQSEYNRYSEHVSMPRECAPVCNRDDAIKTGNIGNMQWNRCNRTICLIDDVTVNAINSDIALDIQQVCGGCGGEGDESTGCTCIMSGLDFTAVDSDIRLQLEQHCTGIHCHKKEDGNVSCEDGNPLNTPTRNLFTGTDIPLITTTQMIIGLTLIGLLFLIIAAIVIRSWR